MKEDRSDYHPLELRSFYLHNAIYKLDSYLVGLEEKVQWLEGEMKVLQKEKADRLYLDAHAAETKAYGMLSQIMDYGKGAPPINQDLGLDAVLILKHIEGLISSMKQVEGDSDTKDGNAWYTLNEIGDYVDQCMQKAKTLSTGESNEKGEGQQGYRVRGTTNRPRLTYRRVRAAV